MSTPRLQDLLKFFTDNGYTSPCDLTKTESLSEIAGRLCYISFNNPRPGGSEAYFKRILESGHGSVLEHVAINFIIEHVSRTLTHELVRHRAGFGYSQLSQRYVDESTTDFVVPPAMQDDEELINLASECFYHCSNAYVQLVEKLMVKYAHIEDKTERRKVARQAARCVLPNATETKIFVTVNARALRHFLEMRCSRHAETEIRVLAYEMWRLVAVEAPNLFGDYSAELLPDGTYELSTPYRKV